MPEPASSPAVLNGGSHYRAVRAQTEALCRPLAVDDHGVQPFVDASPPKWHLAHTAWFFETFCLKPYCRGYRPFDAAFEYLFNSYYNGVGEQFPRPLRGTLSRPTLDEVLAYRRHVDAAMTPLLDRDDAELAGRIELGLQHEHQHQELIVTDIKGNLGSNPLRPAYASGGEASAVEDGLAAALCFVEYPGGIVEIGASGEDFCFDNERPRHKTWLEDFALANRLTTNAEYLQFVAAGGYREPALWLSEGWAWRCANGINAPMYWRQAEGQWLEYRLDGEGPLLPNAPATHVSYFEADAYARWRGARLATEAEWEAAARSLPLEGHFAPRLESADAPTFHPRPAARSELPLAQLFGDCWEWTSSAYAPYPGYCPPAGALGEYNGKFMSSQQVLRGGSCATPRGHLRRSYRNFFYPKDRWQFTGIRLARSQGAAP